MIISKEKTHLKFFWRSLQIAVHVVHGERPDEEDDAEEEAQASVHPHAHIQHICNNT